MPTCSSARRLRTGDVGLIDEDGYIKIVDRLKDMIAVSGFKVFPSQIEAILYRHPAVKEALVIGIPDPHAGERPKAFVTLVDSAEATAGTTLMRLAQSAASASMNASSPSKSATACPRR